MKQYYVYHHIRDDKNEVFYVGIGTRTNQDIRCNTYNRACAKHVDNNIWLKIIAKTTWRFEILFESTDRNEVEQMEIKLIEQHGRKCDNKGTLANLTLGGESNLGYKHTPEAIKKISEKSKRKRGYSNVNYTSELREKLSTIQKEIANRPDRIEYRRELAKGNSYHLGCTHSDESKRKMSESAKKRGTNAKTIKCELKDIILDKSWIADSIEALAKISPISLSTIRRLRSGVKVSKIINNQYKFIIHE